MARIGTESQLADELGVSRQAVAKRRRAGHLMQLPGGMYDLDYARKQWDENRQRRPARTNAKDAEQGGDAASPSGEGSDYWVHKSRREAAEAKLAELKLAETSGKLVARADVERASFTAARILRDQLAAASPRLAAAVVGLPDVVAIERTIAAEHRAVLETFCRMLRVEVPA